MSRFEALLKRPALFEIRWNNALRIMGRINSLLDEGYLILDEGNSPVGRFFVKEDYFVRGYKPLRGDTLPRTEDRHCPALCQVVSETYTLLWFIKDTELDNGMYTPISEYNAQFESWRVVRPEAFQPLFTQAPEE